MSAKFAHAMTKKAQKVALAPRKGKSTARLVLAPQTLLLKRVYLKDGHTGTVIGYAGTAADQKYLVKTSTGDKVEYAFADIDRVEQV